MTLSSVPTSVSVPIENETNGMLSPMTQLLVPAANETNGIASQMTPSPVPASAPIILSGDSRVIYNERKQYDNRH